MSFAGFRSVLLCCPSDYLQYKLDHMCIDTANTVLVNADILPFCLDVASTNSNMQPRLGGWTKHVNHSLSVSEKACTDRVGVCRQHPWFSQHLPRYLAVIQADTMASNPIIDDDMVNEVIKIGFDRETIIHSIKTRQQDKVQNQQTFIPLMSAA